MVVKKYKFILFGLSCLAGLAYLSKFFNSSATPKPLLIYSYSSFTASWGPGPILKKMFEQECGCQVEIRDADDSRLLLQRLRMEGERVHADVVIGINQWDLDDARENLKFLPVTGVFENLPKPLKESAGISGELIPYDWGLMTFNTRSSSEFAKAKNLQDFLKLVPKRSLALQDPRTSVLGLNFLFWLVQIKGEDGAFQFLEQLQDKIMVIASGWSSSYGLFQKGQAKGVFSYVTSPLYHQLEEKDFNYVALAFEEGLPLHIEYAGVLSTCTHCEKARAFTQFLVSPRAQKVLMEKNYMLPVDMTVSEKTPWDLLSQYKMLPLPKFSRVDQQRLLERWTRWMRERQ